MRRTGVLVLVAGLCWPTLACGGEPELIFADWVFPVDDTTPIREYAPVPLEARREGAFELIEDLVIGGDSSDPDGTFYRPTDVLAAANGNIFVVDSGNARIQMFGSDGRFLKSLGQEGQGPGEFQRPTAAAMVGDRLVVSDLRNSRFSVWTDTGEHVADHATPLGFGASRMAGLGDAGMVILGSEVNVGGMQAGSAPSITNVLASYSVSGKERVRLLESAMPAMGDPVAMRTDPRSRIQYMIDSTQSPRPGFAVGGNDRVYVTPSSEYQVIAMDGDGEPAWALRVAWPRPRMLESAKERQVRAFARDDPDIAVDDFDWPEYTSAISSSLLADGDGRLYVFPFTRGLEDGEAEEDPANQSDGDEAEQDEPSTEDEGPRGRAVDIYSPDGELLVAGLAEGRWRSARGEYVYNLSLDPESEELVVYRYRLVLNR